ncbi:MAG: class I SAM-dependent methyltransferase [Anaerolineae bacterium]
MSSSVDYKQLLKDAMLGEAFVKATFSGRRRGYELPWRRATVRPVLIQEERHLQVSHLDETQDITKNYAGVQAAGKIDELLSLPFAQIHVLTTGREIQVQISRKGKARVHERVLTKPLPQPSLAHDRQKSRLLPADEPDPLLQALGIQTQDGRIRANKRRKFRQINEFLRLIVESGDLERLHSPIRIVDCGCGSADLTFATYHYLSHVLNLDVEAVGIDLKADLLAEQNALAQQLGWEDLHFEVSRIIDYRPKARPDVVLALHACDTATDEALAQAVRWGAELIFSAPCCHHHLQAQMEERPMPPVFEPVLRHGILKERVGDVLTDSFRAQILRIMGYRTDVVEFVSPEHTDKNLMIRAVHTVPPGDPEMVEEYRTMIEYWQVRPYLAHLLADEMADFGL